MPQTQGFEEWKSFLSDRVQKAQNVGMNEQTIADIAYQMGDYLAKDIDPGSHEERLLKEMWDVCSEDEQRVLASIMVKMVNPKH